MNSHPLQNSFHTMSYGMENPFGQFQSAILILFPPSFLGPLLTMALALHNTAKKQLETLVDQTLKKTILSHWKQRQHAPLTPQHLLR